MHEHPFPAYFWGLSINTNIKRFKWINKKTGSILHSTMQRTKESSNWPKCFCEVQSDL